MRTIAAALSLLLALSPAAMAAAPQRVLYQGTLRRSGALFTGNATFLFRVTDASGGTQYWTSGSTVVAVNSGLFRYPLGITNTGADGGFPSVSWASIDPYVEVTVDGTVLSPREPMVSVPYALYNLNIANVNKYGDSMIGPLTMWASSITVVNQISTAAFSLAVTTATDRSVYHLYVATTGNVGIGPTNPGANLDVRGLGDTPGQISLQLRNGNSSGFFTSNQIAFGYAGSANYRHAIKTRHNDGGFQSNALDFYTWQPSDAVGSIGSLFNMTINGGNVGIGVTSPGAKLDVRPSASDTYSLFVSSQNGNLLLGVDKAGDVYVGAHAHALSGGDLSANPDLLVGGNIVVDGQFVSHNGIGSSVTFTSNGDFIVGTSTLVVTQGRVGIGTTAPLATLHGVGPVNTTANPALWRAAAIFDNAATSTLTPLEFRVAGTVRSTMRSDSSGNLVLNGTGAGSTYLNYDSGTGGITFGNGAGSSIGSIGNTGNLSLNGAGTFGGNLGIGTTNPTQKLQVVGGAVLSDNTTVDPDSYANSMVAGTIADGSGWSVTGLGGNAGTGDSWGIGHNGGALFFGIQNGAAANSMLSWARVDGTLDTNLYGRTSLGTLAPGSARLRVQGTTADNYHLHIASANGTTDLLVVTSSGAVGINTTNPGAKLHVDGNAFVDTSGTSAAGRHVTIKHSGAGQFDWGNYAGNWSPSLMIQGVTAGGAASSTNFLFMSPLDDTQPARITTTKGLEMYTGAVVSPASSGNLALAFDSTGRASVGGAAAPASTRLWIQGAAADNFHLQVSSQNGTTPLLAVDKNGRTGVGTQSPLRTLDVNGSGAVRGVFDVGGGSMSVSGAGYFGGSLGIGTTNPGTPLHIFRSGANQILIENSVDLAETNMEFRTAGTQKAWIAYGPSGSMLTNTGVGVKIRVKDNLYFGTNDDNVRMTVASSGNLGVGTTAPATKLHMSSGVLTLDGTTGGLSLDADKAADHLALIRNRNATGLGLRVVAGADTLAALTVNDATDSSNKHLLYGNGKAVFGFNGGNVGINTINPAFKLHISSGSLVVDGNGGKIETASGGTATTVACASGAGEAIVGNDMAGKITVGALGAAACTVTFATAYANAPICVASEEITPAAVAPVSLPGSVVLTATFAAADIINYICIGRR